MHNVALNFHPVFIPFNQLLGAIWDCGFWICCIALLYQFLLNQSAWCNIKIFSSDAKDQIWVINTGSHVFRAEQLVDEINGVPVGFDIP